MTTNANVERTAVLGKLKMACEAFRISADRGRALEAQVHEFIDKIQELERAAAQELVKDQLDDAKAALARANKWQGDEDSLVQAADRLVGQLRSTQIDVETLTKQRDAALADAATLKGCVERLQAGPPAGGPVAGPFERTSNLPLGSPEWMRATIARLRGELKSASHRTHEAEERYRKLRDGGLGPATSALVKKLRRRLSAYGPLLAACRDAGLGERPRAPVSTAKLYAVADAYQAAVARDVQESAPVDREVTVTDSIAMVDPRHALERRVKGLELDLAGARTAQSDLARMNHNLRSANARLCSIRDRQRNIIEHRGVVALVDIDDKDIGNASWQKRDTELGEGWVLKFPQRYVVTPAPPAQQIQILRDDATAEQPTPKFDHGKPDLWCEVRHYAHRHGYPIALLDLMLKRRQLGIERYSTCLQPFNGRDAKRDLREELLDATVYAAQVAVERVGGGDPQAALSADVQFKEILAITNAVVSS